MQNDLHRSADRRDDLCRLLVLWEVARRDGEAVTKEQLMTTAVERWKELAEAHHAQTERVRADGGVEKDFWAPIAS